MTVIRRLQHRVEPTRMAVLEGEAFDKVNSIPNAEPWFRTAVVTCAAYAKLIVANRIADSVEYEPDPDLSDTEMEQRQSWKWPEIKARRPDHRHQLC